MPLPAAAEVIEARAFAEFGRAVRLRVEEALHGGGAPPITVWLYLPAGMDAEARLAGHGTELARWLRAQGVLEVHFRVDAKGHALRAGECAWWLQTRV